MHQSRTQFRHRLQRAHAAAANPPVRSGIHEALLGANRVHENLCAPASQRFQNFEIANSIVPAHHVPGDFVLSFEQGGSRYVSLGDLMGKGLGAAMWMTYLSDVVIRGCERGGALAKIMSRINTELHYSRIGVPLTALFLARIEPNASGIIYCSAGCPPAFHLRVDNRVATYDLGGPILGAVPESVYHEGGIELAPGETVVVVSDGVIEFHRGTDFDLRPDYVADHLLYTAGESAIDVVNSLTRKTQLLESSSRDDISVLAIKRLA